uniref:Uncharacterized protein n=1 Tax=Dicentrarchus labrax TaxID=13489 RepID=A0A8P4GEI3_DICLA
VEKPLDIFLSIHDYLLVFCPVASRVGTDVSEALEKLPGGKPAIMVVMHHTFNPKQVVANSRRLVDNPNVFLTVDCLFHYGKLLTCNCNDTAWFDLQKCLGVSDSQVRTRFTVLVQLRNPCGVTHCLRWLFLACGVRMVRARVRTSV